jgi:MFS family permease
MPPRDLATIRLVTERYRELQGLKLVLAAAVFLALLTAEWGGFVPGVLSRSIVGLLACLVWGFGDAYLNSYYSRRFGVVEQPVGLMSALFGLALVIALIVSWGSGSPHPVLAVFAGAHLWIAVRDFPSRTHHLLGCLAAAAVLTTESFPHLVDLHPTLSLTLYPASIVPIGLLDHRMLKILRLHKSEPEFPRPGAD